MATKRSILMRVTFWRAVQEAVLDVERAASATDPSDDLESWEFGASGYGTALDDAESLADAGDVTRAEELLDLVNTGIQESFESALDFGDECD